MTNEEQKKKFQEEEDKDFNEYVSDIWHKLELLHDRGIGVKDGLMVLLLIQLEAVGYSLERITNCISDYNQFCVAAKVTGNIITD